VTGRVLIRYRDVPLRSRIPCKPTLSAAVAIAVLACNRATIGTDDLAAGLFAARPYCGVGQPVRLDVRAPEGVERVDLVLLDADGLMLALPRSVPAGPIELREHMPPAVDIVRERQRACYLQMVVDDEPVGSALVLQPLLSRLLPMTEIAPHPVTGQPHTRIVGWRIESDEPPADEDRGLRQDDAAEPAAVTSLSALPAVPERVFSGLRIYPERDVHMTTTLGEILVALRPDHAPNTAWNFRDLAEGGFYRGVVFHRVVPLTLDGDPFVIQGGDPSGTGEGGPGYWLPAEPSGLSHDFGVISMARADAPDSAGSQFFFCLSREGTARLDGQYCAFGYAVAGAETITAIADVELADITRGRPVDPPVIVDTQLVPAPPRRPGAGRPDARVERPRSEPVSRPGRVAR
jgi:peptidyl-prolyl cis-trans isomerase B (cyclophilin B)